MKRILFFCTGNICRSPMAEVLGRHMFADLDLEFCSTGLNPVPGHGASQSSAEFVATFGLSLADHASRGFLPEELVQCDWVIGMTRSHAAQFKARFGPLYGGKIGVLGAPGFDLARQPFSPSMEEVGDPFGRPRDRYFETGQQIQRLLGGWRETFEQLTGTERA